LHRQSSPGRPAQSFNWELPPSARLAFSAHRGHAGFAMVAVAAQQLVPVGCNAQQHAGAGDGARMEKVSKM